MKRAFHAHAYLLRSPGNVSLRVRVNHQVGFSTCKKRIPTPPVSFLHLVLSIQVFQCVLSDVDSPVRDEIIKNLVV